MKPQILLILAILLLPFENSWAQGTVFSDLKSNLKRADRLYERLAYAPAAELYQKELGKAKTNQDDIKVKLARCYYQLNQPDQAAYWYEQVIAKDSLLTEQDRVRFAQSLSENQQYEQAKVLYQSLEGQPVAQNKLRGLEKIDQFYKDSAYYQVARLDVSTEAAEFGPAFYQDGLIYSSSKTQRSPVEQLFRWNQTPFLDLYFARIDSAGQLEKPKKVRGQINTKFHEGPIALLDSGQRMIFTRNSFYNGKRNLSSERVNKLKLYQAERSGDGSWANVIPLPFNNDEYSTGHPAVSPDGKILYFISDAPGGMGGTDLYMSKYKNGQWSEPRNLGTQINTAANEMFPYVDETGTLYFASEGHAGLGGLDIFRVKRSGEPENLGYPINTHRDDFGLVLDESGTAGYFSSNRLRGGADDDLYRATIIRPTLLLVQGHAVDRATRESIPNVKVVLKNEQGETVDQATADEEGRYLFDLPAGEEYTAVVSKEDYQALEQRIDARNEESAMLEVEHVLERKRFAVEGRVLDRKTGTPVDSTTVTLINKTTGETEEVFVEEGGAYQFDLQADQQYEIRASRQTYLEAVDSVETIGVSYETISMDLAIDKVTFNQPFNLENIYYDFDKWNIRPSAAIELDKLVNFMKDNPTYYVELGSHTDARGNNAYNEDLSQKRSESAVDYIVSEGISRERIKAKGYGETRIMNGCVDEVPCSVAQHQENRRTEFTVVKE